MEAFRNFKKTFVKKFPRFQDKNKLNKKACISVHAFKFYKQF